MSAVVVIWTEIMFDPQAEKMRAQLASLPPLCPPKLPQVSKNSSMPPEGLNTGIYRRTDQLLATLLKLSSEVKVVDVTGKTAGLCLCFYSQFSHISLYLYTTETTIHSLFPPVSASAQLIEQTARLQNLSNALDKLKVTTSAFDVHITEPEIHPRN